MIWGFSTIRNEADIVPYSIPHLFAEGVDRICVYDGRSTDGTREILEDLGVTVLDDPFDYHYQPKLMNNLADTFCEAGDWVLAFDADEFWHATDRDLSIAEALERVPEHVGVLCVRHWGHVDWDHRETMPHALPKVAYRYEPGARVANGNHSVFTPSGGGAAWDVLELRELQFRSFDHMVEKCRLRTDRLDPTLPPGEGVHQTRLAAMTLKELRSEWAAMQARPCVLDPIPALRAMPCR